MTKIFISYSEDDGKKLAKAVRDYLKKFDYDVFVAWQDIQGGELWRGRIDEALKDCDLFVLMLTSAALKSNFVVSEIKKARDLNKIMITCKDEYLGKSWNELPLGLSEYQGITFDDEDELKRKLINKIEETLKKTTGFKARLTLKTEKFSYRKGESIKISGTVPAVIEDLRVVIEVFNPRSTMYTIDQPLPNADGTYTTTTKIEGQQGISGIYNVKATYANQSVQTTFEFYEEIVTLQGFRVKVGEKTFDIDAELSNGSIHSIDVDPYFKSIIIVTGTSQTVGGTLKMTLPRNLIDARADSADDDFVVLVDGEEETYEEADTTSTTRTLIISIPARSEDIEIIGTQVASNER